MTAPVKLSPSALVESHLPLVRKLAGEVGRRLPPHVERDDLVQCGAVALAEAVRGYQPGRGHNFVTFAYLRVKGAMSDYTRGVDGMRPLARGEHKRDRPRCRPLAPAERNRPGATDPAQQAAEADAFEAMLRPLPQVHRLLMRLIYRAGLSQDEAARAIGFTPSRASQLHAESLRALREGYAGSEVQS
jgi:RNA polymerase sigma factor for flagellar operon FliA